MLMSWLLKESRLRNFPCRPIMLCRRQYTINIDILYRLRLLSTSTIAYRRQCKTDKQPNDLTNETSNTVPTRRTPNKSKYTTQYQLQRLSNLLSLQLFNSYQCTICIPIVMMMIFVQRKPRENCFILYYCNCVGNLAYIIIISSQHLIYRSYRLI